MDGAPFRLVLIRYDAKTRPDSSPCYSDNGVLRLTRPIVDTLWATCIELWHNGNPVGQLRTRGLGEVPIDC